MLNLRYIVRLVGAFITRFKFLILLSIGIGVAFFFILRFAIPSILTNRPLRIGITGRFTASSLPNTILEMIGDGLTKLDENGTVEPALAASWDSPDKGKTWTFTLKDNLTWQDGKKVTSAGILYQFSDVTIERTNDKSITFKLQTPYSAFPSVVSKPTFKSGLLGTGEYKVTKISLNGSVIEQLNLEKEGGGRVVYKFYPTEEKTKLALELGLVDRISGIFDPKPFDTWKKLKITESSNTGEFVGVFFNTQDQLLAEKDLRQALSYAIDKEKLNGQRAISPISIDSWAYNPQVKHYDYDLAKAKTMIKEYMDSSNISEISITLATTPVLLNTAEAIAKNWGEAGIGVNLQVITQVPSDYQAFLAIFDMPSDPDQYSMWHSTQTTSNITHYQNPRIDKLLEDGRSETNTEDRKKIYLDFQRFLVEDSPAAFLYYPTTYIIGRK